MSGSGDRQTKKRPTAQDVAERAGVSRTQVSYVLNNNRIEHVSNERVQRILSAAKDLGYQPHSSAQTLRRGYSNEFSIFFPAPYPPRINEIIGTIHEAGLKGNCVPIQYSFNSYRDSGRMRESLSVLLSRQPFGIFCSLLDIGNTEIELIKNKGVRKILVLDIESHKDIPTLHLPVESVGYLAAGHLLEKGHRRIGILSPVDPVQKRAFILRTAGMHKAMAEGSGTELTVHSWPDGNPRPTLESARLFTESFLSLTDRPTALYAYGDDYALPILSCLKDRGIRVPDNLALIGTDDLKYSSMVGPGLTTIRFDSQDLGERAVAMINSLITGEPIDERFKDPPQPVLIARGTT